MTDFLDRQIHQQEFNAVIRTWGRGTRTTYLRKLRELPFKTRVELRKEILRGRVGIGFKRVAGDIVRVRWGFVRHGIFQEHGVGRGRKKGSGKEKPMPWIKPTLDAQVPILADSLQAQTVKTLGLVIQIKVNGIFEAELK
jgi:hypothetical protein